MIIRIEFEDLQSEGTQETQFQFFGSPNGTCLTSTGAHPINAVSNSPVIFWYLDSDIIDEHYSGWSSCKDHLESFPGVKSVTEVLGC